MGMMRIESFRAGLRRSHLDRAPVVSQPPSFLESVRSSHPDTLQVLLASTLGASARIEVARPSAAIKKVPATPDRETGPVSWLRVSRRTVREGAYTGTPRSSVQQYRRGLRKADRGEADTVLFGWMLEGLRSKHDFVTLRCTQLQKRQPAKDKGGKETERRSFVREKGLLQ